MSDTAGTPEPVILADDGTPLPYADALGELEAILGELDGGRADVDHLAERVRRATALVAHCRARLGAVRADLDDAVAESDPDA